MSMFSGRILITGFGIVAQALLPLLFKHLRVPAHRITVVEFAERPQLQPWRKKGVRLVRERVTPSNLARLLGAHAGPGDLLVDLTWSIDFFAILKWRMLTACSIRTHRSSRGTPPTSSRAYRRWTSRSTAATRAR
ncbi:MAG TPA: saccharopine dehydrogenase NADP-binding domain-containing protein [Burkholderiales bacterium]|nr:saccharopine dehydrogenase NADP-binding domain-containing protein [Burkholderiales bacterium]